MAFLGLSIGTSAQAPAFRARTDLVALAVTVVGADGRPALGLSKDAFSLIEDDRPQSIVQFTGDPVPLSLAIALDASSSMKGRRFEYARDAVWRLLDHLAPTDEVCVYGFNDRPFVIAPWTSDVHAVERWHQYLLGFVPAHPDDGKFHRVRVTVTGCACRVRARAGFIKEKHRAP